MMRGCWLVALMVASFSVRGADWIPFDVQKDIVPGSALDFSGLGLQDAPAGKHGPLRVVGDHFEFARLPGVAQRFYGANLCYSANFPEPSLAVRMAERFQRIGYNAVRIHHYDRACTRIVDGELQLDAEVMARLDFLAAEFIRRGIYLTTDLYVSRKPTWKDIGEPEQGDGKCPFKVLALCHEGAFRNWCAFARLFLKHVNPYTGRAWGEEPALLFLPLVNEGAFSNPKTWASLVRIPAFRAAFAKWIRQERERAPDAFPEVVGEEPPEDLNRIGARHSAVYANFLAYLERTGFARMRAYLRDELGVKVPLTNQNCGPHLPPMQAVREEVYDFVDDHTYVDHPSFLGKTAWTLPVRLGNGGKTQLGKGLCCAIADLSFTRLVNKPFTVTEWNFAAPGPHRAQGGLMMGAAASLQDWDGLWRFAYAHDVRDAEEQPRRIDFFNVATDPVSLAGERAGILLFLRRDVEPLATTVARLVDDGAMRPAKGTACAPVKPGWANLLWRTKVGTCRPGSLPKEAFGVPFAAKTAKDRLPADLPANGGVRIDTAKRTLAIATARTCGGYAPAEAGEVGAGDFSFAVGEDSAAVWASALDGADLAHAGRVLVSHVTDARNTGIAFSNETVSVMTKWGKAPVLARTGTATVALNLDSPRGVRVWALDAVGNRKNVVPSEIRGGRLRFTTSVQQPFGACFHYEVAIERQLREGEE